MEKTTGCVIPKTLRGKDMKNILRGILTFVFLVVLAPVFLFSMLAPVHFDTILLYWSGFVLSAGIVLGGLFAYMRSDL